MLVKTYYCHTQYPDFRKEITYVSTHNDLYLNNCVMATYYFTGEEHDIIPKPHGNSKVKEVGHTAVKTNLLVVQTSQLISVKEALIIQINGNGSRPAIALENLPNSSQLSRASSEGTQEPPQTYVKLFNGQRATKTFVVLLQRILNP